MTVGSLFAGIGGFDLGFERAGFEIKWQVEIDPFCRQVLAKHWPDVRRYEDVRDVLSAERVDVLCGGFPCQPVSENGRRGAFQDDDRWMWPEFERLIRTLRPRYVAVENVAGLRHRGMGDVLGGLAALGFDAEWESLPAAAFGAPHGRDRIWFVAYPRDTRRPAADEAVRPGRQDETAVIALRDGERWPQAVWPPEPKVERMVYGLPRGLATWHRAAIGALGNSIVPQIAEWIASRILEAETEAHA